MPPNPKLEHVPRYFFKEVRNGNLENAAGYLAKMIESHLERYPNNDDMLTMFISSHLIFTLDLTGYLDVIEGVPVEPIILREIRRWHAEYEDQPDAICILAGNILHCVDIFSRCDPFTGTSPLHKGAAEDSPHAGRIRTICAYVDKHYRDPNLSVNSLADRFGISLSYLSRVFHQVTGFHLGEYISMLRFQEANRLLRTTELPIAEIASSCGFSSCSAFIRSYRAKEGVTPGARRKQFQLKQAPQGSA